METVFFYFIIKEFQLMNAEDFISKRSPLLSLCR